MDKNIFAKRLDQLLTDKGLKKTQLSKETSIPKADITNYINGRYKARQDRIHVLAKYFNVSEAWLIGYDLLLEKQGYQNVSNVIKLNGNTHKVPLLSKISCGIM